MSSCLMIKHKRTNLAFKNTNVIGDVVKNTICLLVQQDKIDVFLCCDKKYDFWICVVMTDLPYF